MTMFGDRRRPRDDDINRSRKNSYNDEMIMAVIMLFPNALRWVSSSKTKATDADLQY